MFAFPAYSQTAQQEPLPGPDTHEPGQGPHGHRFGDWGGDRARLLKRGVSFDFQRFPPESQERAERRGLQLRGTLDIDFGALPGEQGCISTRRRSGRAAAIPEPIWVSSPIPAGFRTGFFRVWRGSPLHVVVELIGPDPCFPLMLTPVDWRPEPPRRRPLRHVAALVSPRQHRRGRRRPPPTAPRPPASEHADRRSLHLGVTHAKPGRP